MEGIVPVRIFTYAAKYCNFDSVPIVEGILPLIELKLISKCVSSDNIPISEGILADK